MKTDKKKRSSESSGSSKLRFQEYTAEAAEKDESELSRGNYGKIKPGKNAIRILPAREGEQWKLVFHKHFIDVSGQVVSFICPFLQTKGKRRCKVCDRVKKMLESGDKADLLKADRIKAQTKVMFNAVDRSDEDSGPKTYEVGVGIHRKLIEFRKVEGINFTHPMDGCDVHIIKTGEGRVKTRYTTTLSREDSPLHASKKVMQEWIENQPELKIVIDSDEDIEARLRGEDPRENRRNKRDEDEDEEPKTRRQKAVAKQASRDEDEDELDDDDFDDQEEDEDDEESEEFTF